MVTHVTRHQPAFALIVHFHAIVFVGWLVMFTVQVFLVRTKKLSVHKQLGFALTWLAGLMVIFANQMLALSLYFSPDWLVCAKRIIAAWPW